MPSAGQRAGPAAARGRRDRRRQDQHARDGHPARHRARPLRPRPQPVGHVAHARRLLGRERRRGGVRHGAGRPRERRRRLDPHPGVVLRPGRPQAEPRPRVARAGVQRVRGRGRDRGLRQPQRRRHRADPRRDLGLRAGRPVLGARPRSARSSRRSTATPGTLRIALRDRRSQRRAGARRLRRGGGRDRGAARVARPHGRGGAARSPTSGYVENFIKIWTAGRRGRGAHLRPPAGRAARPRQARAARPGRWSTLADSWKADGLPRARSTTCGSMARQLVATWSDIDILLTPTVAQPPLPIGGLAPKEGEPAIQWLLNAAAWVPFTPGLERDRAARDLAAAACSRRRACPIGVQLVGPARRRGAAAVAVRAARGGAAVGRAATGAGGGMSEPASAVRRRRWRAPCATARSARWSWSRRTSTAPRSART